MNATNKMLGQRWSESQFEVDPKLVEAARGSIEAELEQLKNNLLQPILQSVSNTRLVKDLSWAANEAAALAWFTVCPVLVFPALLEEKIQAALKKWEKQEQLLHCGA
jgi:hypothetical protein